MQSCLTCSSYLPSSAKPLGSLRCSYSSSFHTTSVSGRIVSTSVHLCVPLIPWLPCFKNFQSVKVGKFYHHYVVCIHLLDLLNSYSETSNSSNSPAALPERYTSSRRSLILLVPSRSKSFHLTGYCRSTLLNPSNRNMYMKFLASPGSTFAAHLWWPQQTLCLEMWDII